MIYYHFADKLALYRSRASPTGSGRWASGVTAIAAAAVAPQQKLDRFIEALRPHDGERPWLPTLMLREIAEGAPHLDLDTMAHMRTVFVSFGRDSAGRRGGGVFRKIHPILAYESIVGPLIINAARERVAAQPARKPALPMLVAISHDDLIAHGQETARRMLART